MSIIPLEYYFIFYYNVLLLFVIIVFTQSYQSDLTDSDNIKGKNTLGVIFFLFVLLIIGLRPISFAFGDMGIYNLEYRKYMRGDDLVSNKDILFKKFMQWSALLMPPSYFFFICASAYVIPLYLASKKIFEQYWFYAFCMLVVSLSFFAYGTNGIRNGIATSFFLLAISRTNKIFLLLWFFLAMSVHKSIMLPIIAYFFAMTYNKPKVYLAFWVSSIPLSLILGGFWARFFIGLGFGEEERLEAYLGAGELDLHEDIVTGFRWDFIIYSMTGVFAGWYFIFKKKFDDVFYNRLYSTYLIANGFWILVIEANFSNRFAYLSWFMLGLVIIYPLLKNKIVEKQHQLIGAITMVYFMFTYLLNNIL